MGPNREKYSRVKSLVELHERWFAECLPLVASENLASRSVREVLSSDMEQRYAEGPLGARVYAGCKYMDEIEVIAIDLAKKLFGGDFADVRPISGLTANLSVYSGLTRPGDATLALSTVSGGHISSVGSDLSGSAGLVHGLDVQYLEFDEGRLNIDVDASTKKLRAMVATGRPPKIIVLGASLFLFPHPVREFADEARSNGVVVMYDAAHVAGLIAGRQFQDPMSEGADVMTFSTHKTLFGPQGGTVVGKTTLSGRVDLGVFPGTTSNHHPQLVAGKALAFAELMEYGEQYAKDVIANAKALAESLSSEGETVLGEALGFTKSHQLVVVASKYGGGIKAEKLLENNNVIANRQSIPRSPSAAAAPGGPQGVRIGVAEITRLGLGKGDMPEVAKIVSLSLNGSARETILSRIRSLREDAMTARYTFDDSPAYFYSAGHAGTVGRS